MLWTVPGYMIPDELTGLSQFGEKGPAIAGRSLEIKFLKIECGRKGRIPAAQHARAS